ncbi:MAG: protoporphyrinogen oxidase, partial [Chlamydiia bacterium]|nr:protoporphyrinogen oxidase [Chlamydiia bacterium]
LFEKENRLGGRIESCQKAGLFFEKGPRIFPTARSPHLLQLIREVGLEKEILFAPSCAKKRYLWTDGALRTFSSFAPHLLFSLFKEPFQPKGKEEDESIASFARRRFGEFVTNVLIDPLTLGIYGGDIESLSMRSCFPSLFFLEKEKGRLFPHLLFQNRSTSRLPRFFTLQRGMSSLIEKLAEKANIQILLNQTVERFEGNGIVINGTFYTADLIFSALPLPVIGRLTGLWPHAQAKDLTIAHLAYKGVKLPKSGFGYLVPSKEKEMLLGMVWESSLFREQGPPNTTRVTGIIREGGIEVLKSAMVRHLSIHDEPIFEAVHHVQEAIPQFSVGYWRQLEQFQKEVKQTFPNVWLLGNYLGSPSVEGCIVEAMNKT